MAGDKEIYEYAAFISYRHVVRDRKWAKWLLNAVETYRVPKPLQKQGFPARIGKLFRDEEEIPASADLSDQIRQALEKSKFLIVICSTETPASKWVAEEIRTFHALGRSERILALLVEGEPDEAFPKLLLKIPERVTDDGEIIWKKEEREPIAADVRSREDVSDRELKKLAKLRIAATLLGTKFDDLRRRDEARQKKRLQMTVAASIAAVIFTTGLSMFAYLQRQEAIRQEQLAIKARFSDKTKKKSLEEIKKMITAYPQIEISTEKKYETLLHSAKIVLLTSISVSNVDYYVKIIDDNNKSLIDFGNIKYIERDSHLALINSITLPNRSVIFKSCISYYDLHSGMYVNIIKSHEEDKKIWEDSTNNYKLLAKTKTNLPIIHKSTKKISCNTSSKFNATQSGSKMEYINKNTSSIIKSILQGVADISIDIWRSSFDKNKYYSEISLNTSVDIRDISYKIIVQGEKGYKKIWRGKIGSLEVNNYYPITDEGSADPKKIVHGGLLTAKICLSYYNTVGKIHIKKEWNLIRDHKQVKSQKADHNVITMLYKSLPTLYIYKTKTFCI